MFTWRNFSLPTGKEPYGRRVAGREFSSGGIQNASANLGTAYRLKRCNAASRR